MDPVAILIVVTVLLLVLLLAECPVAFALGLAGFVGIALSGRLDAGAAALGATPYSATAVYGLAVIPMYILLGMFAFHARIPEEIYAVAARLLWRVPGGLGIATVSACAGFASVSGSSVATAATMARISVQEMRDRGYRSSFAGGLVATAGGLGMIIPPSIVLVVYAFITGESVARMLVAGIVPGLVLAAAYGTYIVMRGRALVATAPVTDSLPAPAPLGASVGGTSAEGHVQETPASDRRPEDTPGSQGADAPQLPRFRDLPYGGALRAAILFGVIVAGIQGGLVTVTESGGLAVVAALLMLVAVRWKEGPKAVVRRIGESLSAAAATTGMVLMVLVGASIFSFYLISSGIPAQFASWLVELDIPPILLVAMMLLIVVPLGMFLESLSIMLIVLPLTYPVVEQLGYDGVWYGILLVILVELGMVTPPVGLNVFVVADAVRDLEVGEVFRGVLPFVLVTLGVVLLLFLFPDIVLWLPGLVAG